MSLFFGLLFSLSAFAETDDIKGLDRLAPWKDIPGYVSHCNVFFQSEKVQLYCNPTIVKKNLYEQMIGWGSFGDPQKSFSNGLFMLQQVGFKVIHCFPPTKKEYNCLVKRTPSVVVND